MADWVAAGAGAAAAGGNLLSSLFTSRYQKKLNQKVMQREDNAVQRRAADMQAAGLSKTLAAGSPASATSLSAPPAPKFDNKFSQDMAAMRSLKQMDANIAATNAQQDWINLQKEEKAYNLGLAQEAGVRTDTNSWASQFAEALNLFNKGISGEGLGSSLMSAVKPIADKAVAGVERVTDQNVANVVTDRESFDRAYDQAIDEGKLGLAQRIGDFAAEKWNNSALGQWANERNERLRSEGRR